MLSGLAGPAEVMLLLTLGVWTGVECVVVHTEYAEHAHELVASMSLEDLEGYDGLLAVRPPLMLCIV